LHFIDENATIEFSDGRVHFKYRSISIRELPHMEACNFFDRGFPVQAELIGVTVYELLDNAAI